MQYVADRLFSKVSGMDAGDAAFGAGAVGLGALAAGAPRGAAGLESARNALAQEAQIRANAMAGQMKNPNVSPARAARIADEVTPVLRRYVAAGKAADMGRRALTAASDPRARIGAGALAGLLGAGGLYGTLKD